MNRARESEYVDFTDGNLNGWEILPNPRAFLQREGDNYFVGSKEPYRYNGVEMSKFIPGLEVGVPYAFSIAMRTFGAGMMGLQVILGNGFSGAHIALRIELSYAEVDPGNWQVLKGYLIKRAAVSSEEFLLNTYSMYPLDIDNISLSFAPLGREGADVFLEVEPHAKIIL